MRLPKAVLRLLLSLLIGSAVTGLWWLDTSDYPRWLDTLIAVLFMPGMFVGVIAGGGGIHDTKFGGRDKHCSLLDVRHLLFPAMVPEALILPPSRGLAGLELPRMRRPVASWLFHAACCRRI
jgi:hypothetical protein